MRIGTKNYGSYMGQGRSNLRSRKITECRYAYLMAVICPYTLEAVKDCASRRAPHARCRYSLEGCRARSRDSRRLKRA